MRDSRTLEEAFLSLPAPARLDLLKFLESL